MPSIERSPEIEIEWEDQHVEDLVNQEPRDEQLHISDLILCLRQTTLGRQYAPKWEFTTALRFAFGRAFETALAKTYLRNTTQELEVYLEDLVGHIDFGDDPHDWECKFTWGRAPTESYLKTYWLEQAGSYAIARGRTQSRFAVFYMLPVPGVQIYVVTWTEEELEQLKSIMLNRRDYVATHLSEGTHPPKTPLTWLCKGCAYKWICDDVESTLDLGGLE